MALLHKEDWEEYKQRILAWWRHESIGRCALAVSAPRKNPPAIEPPPEAKSPEQRWYDLEWNARWMDYELSRNYFGAESLPIWNAGYAGPGALPAVFGCPTDVDMNTGWSRPILDDPERLDTSHLFLDETHPEYQFAMATKAAAVLHGRGKALPTSGAIGGSGDTLAALRGTEQLLLDCAFRPEQVRVAEDQMMEIWCDFFDRGYAITREAAEGSTGWFPLWSPGKFYPVQNDFSFNIGPGMYRELFLPAIRRQTEFLDHSVYHLDGVNAFVHLDALLELPRLQAFQILPGAGKPSPLHYPDTLRKVQAAGKNLHITIPPEEVESALGLLDARGLFIDTWTDSEDAARKLLAQAERWSRNP
jgi:hypothetical protein